MLDDRGHVLDSVSERRQVERHFVEDEELRENLRNAFVSLKKAYGRINGQGPAKALDDKKVKRELNDAAGSLKDAADSLLGPKKKRKRRRHAPASPPAGPIVEARDRVTGATTAVTSSAE